MSTDVDVSSNQKNVYVIYTHVKKINNQLDINNLCHIFHIFELIKEEKEKNNKILVICKNLCSKYNLCITPRALAKRFSRYIKNCEKFDERQIFNARTEVLFVSILEAFSLLDRPLSRQSFLEYVIEKRSLNRSWNPAGWFSNFMKRFSSNIGLRTLSSISENRSIRANYHTFNEFAEEFERITNEYNFSDENKLNIDETRFSINLDKMKLKGIVSLKKIVPAYQEPKRHPCASYVPVINNHKMIISFLVIPASMVNNVDLNPYKSSYQTRNGYAPMFILYTDSGFVNKDAWLFMLKKISELFEYQKNNRKKLLIMDNLSIHCSIESIDLCIKHNIVPLFLPKYSSHVTQPLDQLVFANLKKEFRSNVVRKLPFIAPERAICLELTQLFDNIKKIITEPIIKKSWKQCCLIPWDKENWLLRGQQVCKITSENKNETIIEELTSMVMNIIPYETRNIKNGNAITTNTSSSVSDEMINYFPNNSTKKNKNSLTSSSNSTKSKISSDDLGNKIIKSKKKHVFCSCQFHENDDFDEDDIESSWETCQHCNIFRLCINCYSSYPEVIVSHEQTCENLTSKKCKKRRKTNNNKLKST